MMEGRVNKRDICMTCVRCETYNDFVPRRFYDWVTGDDNGISSGTIYEAATGLPSPHWDHDVPRDADDFGRCHRLLTLFPEFRQKLGDTVRLCEEWAPFVECWDELVALYESEIPTGAFVATDRRIGEIRDTVEAQCPND